MTQPSGRSWWRRIASDDLEVREKRQHQGGVELLQRQGGGACGDAGKRLCTEREWLSVCQQAIALDVNGDGRPVLQRLTRLAQKAHTRGITARATTRQTTLRGTPTRAKSR